jgi:peptidoglycan/LPS O-acetylase OafA/YrhL
MKRDVSIFLDAARFTAATLVVAGHTEWTFAPGFLPFIRTGHLATLAVGIFFVLSGFVIAFTVSEREAAAAQYFVARAARVYSVVVPAMIMTLLFDTAGKWLAPTAYSGTLAFSSVARECIKLLISLTFVNADWGWYLDPGTDVPFWSLAYEVPYYVMFGLCFFGGARCWIAALVILLSVGPFVAFLFPLWLLGYFSYQICRLISLSQALGRGLAAVGGVLLCCSPYFSQAFPETAPFDKTFFGLLQFFLAGIPFAIMTIGMWFANIAFRPNIGRAIQWASGGTFTLYLVHFPMGLFLDTIVPSGWNLATRWLIIFFSLVLGCLLISEFTERSKSLWRALFSRLLFGLIAIKERLNTA